MSDIQGSVGGQTDPAGAAWPARFRKRPVVIEAMRFTHENGAAVWEWADSKPMYGTDREVCGLRIYTLEGDMKADFGDWIIRGVQGEFYPCKPDIFEATYEPADLSDRCWDCKGPLSDGEESAMSGLCQVCLNGPLPKQGASDV